MTYLLARLIRVFVALAVVSGSLVWSADVSAETDLKMAKNKFKEGRKAYRDEDFAEAAELFLEAYQYSGRSELLFNIGQAYRLADRLTEAETYFQQYLSEMPDAKNADEVVNLVIEIQQEVAARMATVQVNTTVPGREVFVDAEELERCTTPCTLNLNPGEYTLTLRGEGAKEKTRRIKIGKAEKLDINEKLAADRMTGRLVVFTDRAGRLRVGTDVDQVLNEGQNEVEVLDGTYPVVITSGRARVETEVTLKGRDEVRVIVPLSDLDAAESRGSWMKIGAYSLGGASAGLAVGALFAGLQAQSTFDELERQQSDGGFVDSGLLEAGQGEEQVANTLWFSAAGALVVAATFYVVDELVMGGDDTVSAVAPSEPNPEPKPAVEKPVKASEPAEEPASPEDDDLLL